SPRRATAHVETDPGADSGPCGGDCRVRLHPSLRRHLRAADSRRRVRGSRVAEARRRDSDRWPARRIRGVVAVRAAPNPGCRDESVLGCRMGVPAPSMNARAQEWTADHLPWITMALIALWLPPVVVALLADVGVVQQTGFPGLSDPSMFLPVI